MSHDIQHKYVHVPLQDSDGKLLPIHFLSHNEYGHEQSLLRTWLDVTVTDGGLWCCRIRLHRPPALIQQMIDDWLDYYKSLNELAQLQQQKKKCHQQRYHHPPPSQQQHYRGAGSNVATSTSSASLIIRPPSPTRTGNSAKTSSSTLLLTTASRGCQTATSADVVTAVSASALSTKQTSDSAGLTSGVAPQRDTSSLVQDVTEDGEKGGRSVTSKQRHEGGVVMSANADVMSSKADVASSVVAVTVRAVVEEAGSSSEEESENED